LSTNKWGCIELTGFILQKIQADFACRVVKQRVNNNVENKLGVDLINDFSGYEAFANARDLPALALA